MKWPPSRSTTSTAAPRTASPSSYGTTHAQPCLPAPEGGGARPVARGPGRHLWQRAEGARRACRPTAGQAGADRPGQEHHRHLHLRQRRLPVHVARGRHLAVPWRQGHDLGRRLARAFRDALAGRTCRPGEQRDRRHDRSVAYARRSCRRAGRRRQAEEGRDRSVAATTSCTSTASTRRHCSRARARSPRAATSSTTTKPCSRPSATSSSRSPSRRRKVGTGTIRC